MKLFPHFISHISSFFHKHSQAVIWAELAALVFLFFGLFPAFHQKALNVLSGRPLASSSDASKAPAKSSIKWVDFNVTAEVPCHVGAEIPVIPYFRPGSKELAEAVIAAMKDHNSVLLQKHGQVVCGKDFNQAFERAMFFEMACRIIVLSGGKYKTLTKEEIDDLETYILGKKTK